MGSQQTNNEIQRLRKEIASQREKYAKESQNQATLMKQIGDIERSITKNTSISTLQSKQRQMQQKNSDIQKSVARQADINKLIAQKEKRISELEPRYFKQLEDEQKNVRKKELQNQQNLLRQIENLNLQLHNQRQHQIVSSLHGIDIPDVSPHDGEYDVFISHAWEDKESFVEDFVKELTLLNIKAWYDKTQITWGDSMRARIDKGLRKSKFGVVVISPYFTRDEKYWTHAELDGLFQRETYMGKFILPIWHNITKNEVQNYSPLIAGKLAMTTATMTAKEIATELDKLLNPTQEN